MSIAYLKKKGKKKKKKKEKEGGLTIWHLLENTVMPFCVCHIESLCPYAHNQHRDAGITPREVEDSFPTSVQEPL